MARNPPGRPRTEPLEAQRRRVLDVARRAFTEHGYESTTVSQIAIEAGVSRVTVHEIFGDKARLASSVIEDLSSEFQAAVDRHLERAGDAAAPREVDGLIRDDVMWFIATLCSDPSILALVQLGSWLGRDAESAAGAVRRRVEHQIAELYRTRARALGIERGESADLVAAGVVSFVEAVASRILERGWPVDQASAVIADFVTAGYLHIETHSVETVDAFDASARS